jgi:hypothetical protein
VFDGRGFQPHGLFKSFVVTLKGKIVLVDIKVLDAPLDYNLLLGRSWFYAMIVVSYSIFNILQFPHQGKIVTIGQLDYCTPDLHNSPANNVPFFRQSSIEYESVGVSLLKDSSLMAISPFPSPDTPHVATLNIILTQV